MGFRQLKPEKDSILFSKILKIPALQAKPSSDVQPNGYASAEFIIERVIDAWDDLQEKIGALSQEDKDKIEVYFNHFIEGEDDLGTILSGDADDFDTRLKLLSTEDMNLYTKELIN